MQSGANRSKYLLSRVRGLIGFDSNKVADEHIFFIASEKSRDIAEKYFCIEATMNLSILASTATYDLTLNGSSNQTGFYRLRYIELASGDNTTIQEVGSEDLDFIKRFTSLGVSPLQRLYKIEAGSITIYPTPSASATWILHFFKSPVNLMSITVAPETPSAFDTAILHGTLMEVAQMSGRKDLLEQYNYASYEGEKQKALESYRGTKTNSIQIHFHEF